MLFILTLGLSAYSHGAVTLFSFRIAGKMSQKRITAFFSKPKPKDSEESVGNNTAADVKTQDKTPTKASTKVPLSSALEDDGSPLKKVKPRKRVLISDSEDSGHEDVVDKKLKSDSSAAGKALEKNEAKPKEDVKKDEGTEKKLKAKSPASNGKKTPTRKKEAAGKKTPATSKNGKAKAKEAAITKVEEADKSDVDDKPQNESKTEDSSENEKEKSDQGPKPDAMQELEESPKAAKQLHSFFTSKKDKEEKTPSDKPKDVDYNPSKSDYHPIDDAVWKEGEKVPYIALARTLELIEATSSRLKMIEILANYVRSLFVLSPEDVLCSVYLCLNQLAPAYVGLELGIGEGLIVKALAQATGRSVDKIKADASAKGDLGLVAETSKGTQRTLTMFKPPILTVRGVFEKLTEVASMTGNASQGKKVDKIHSLLVACRQLEARYLTRSLAGKLRIGLAEQSLLQALALASTVTPPNQPRPFKTLNATKKLSTDALKARVEENAILIKTAYCQCPSYDRLIPALLREGVDRLPVHCTLTPGVPLKPMLACPTRGVSEVLQRFENTKFTCEWKYDGERAQIHLLENGSINIYSRNQENNTSKYPDIIKRFTSWVSPATQVKSAILDTEVVAWDTEKKQILPFQVLSTRKRKDAVESDIKVQICIFAFDILYINGESLVKETLLERRKRLRQSFQEVEGQFTFAQGRDPETMEEVEELLDESIKGHCEGLMVKALEVNATYEIAKRSHNWLKLKKDYIEGVGDTIDAVVIGGYLGRGKRTGTYGGFLLACYDENNEEFQSLCKIGTGFSDEDFQQHSAFLKDRVIDRPKSYYRYDQSLAPDHWFEPVQVWEIKCADLSVSPVHRAAVGIVDPEKGISLRFPRFLRIRDDKHPEDATSASQIAELYRSQEQTKHRDVKPADEEEDFY